MKRLAPGRASLFGAGLAAWVVVANASGPLSGFDDRVVSAASLAGVDVDARTRTYAWALLAFIVGGAVATWLASLVERVCGAETRDDVEDASLVGVALLVAAAAGSAEVAAVRTLAALLVAFVLGRVLDARVFRASVHPRPGLAFASTACGAFGLASLTPWRGSGVAVALLASGMHLVLHGLARRPAGSRAVVRALAVLTASAWTPLALVVREELRLDGVPDTIATLTVVALVAILAVVAARAWGRGKRYDVERALSRSALPGLLLGFAFLSYWVVQREPLPEMFEGANAGLTIQQWFEHGRWPFVDTFSVHGLSDSGMGLLYALVHGWSGTTWQHWDLVPYVAASIAAYAVTARVTGSALLAFAVFAASPFAKDSFPQMVSIAVVFTFVAVRAARSNRVLVFAWSAVAWVAFVAWRLDLGAAAAVGLVAAIVAAHAIEPERPLAWARRVTPFLAVCVVAALVAWIVCRVRGVDAWDRVQDLAGVLGSNQAFGRTTVATRLDSGVTLRLFAVPAAVIAVLVLAVARARRRDALDSPRGAAVVALVFLGAFSLAIATRGLVRHTFVENEGEYATAFGFAVLSLAPCVLVDASRRTAAWAAFLALHALLPSAMRVGQGPQQDGGVRGNLYARVVHRLESWRALPGDASRVERSPVTDEFRAHNVEPLRSLCERCLSGEETFLDLSGSPMLYVYSGARSPHWLNHVIAVQGETMQRRFESVIGRRDVPCVVLHQDAARAAAEGMRADVEIDGVPLELWHSRLFARAHAVCVPFRAAGRWDVWTTSSWAAPASSETLERTASLSTSDARARATIEAAPGETIVVRFRARVGSEGRVRVAWNRHEAGFVADESRDVDWDATWSEREIAILGEGGAYRVEDLHVDVAAQDHGQEASIGSGGVLAFESIDVGVSRDPEYTTIAARTAVPVATHWGPLARAWGAHDPFPRRPGTSWHGNSSHGDSSPGGDAAPLRAVVGADGRARARLEIPPTGPREHEALLVVELESPGSGSTRVTLTYGAGPVASGTFDFDLPRGGREVCVLRPGLQALWARRPNDWLEFSTDGVPLDVRSVATAHDE